MAPSHYPGGHAGNINARIDRQDIIAADKNIFHFQRCSNASPISRSA